MFAFMVVGIFIASVFAVEIIKGWRRDTELLREREGRDSSLRSERLRVSSGASSEAQRDTGVPEEIQRELLALRREVVELREYVGDTHFGMTRRA